MNQHNTDPQAGAGGSFTVNDRGERELVVPPTASHPDGDCARDAKDAPADRPAASTESALPAPAPAPWAPQV